MQTEPLISVIVPVYNVAPYLELALDSIRYQSYQNLEIILINDGSTDDSESICKDIASQDERFRYIYQENAGASVARNRGLDLANGEYIIFVDSDDWLERNAIEFLYQNLIKYDTDIASGNYNMYHDVNQQFHIKVFDDDYSETLYDNREDIVKHIAEQEMRDMAWSGPVMKLFKRELFDGLRFPVGKSVEDTFIMYKVFIKAKRVIHIEKAIYWYRIGQESSLNSLWSEKRVIDEMMAWDERLALIGMLGYDISGHSFLYHCRATRALEKLEEAGLQKSETYRRVKEKLYILSREWEK